MIIYPDRSFNMVNANSGDGSEYKSQSYPTSYQILRVGDRYIFGADDVWSCGGKLKVRISSYTHEAAVYPNTERHRRLEQKKIFGIKRTKVARLVQ